MNAPRYAGDYTILNSIAIGSREVVLGENRNHQDGPMYMCGLIRPRTALETPNLSLSASDFFEAMRTLPPDLEREVISRDYLIILHLYQEYIRYQTECVAWELSGLPFREQIYTEADCCEETFGAVIMNEIVVMRADVLQPEYRMGNFQLVLVTGGEGAWEDAPDNAVIFGENLFSGQRGVWKREDVLGVLCENRYPEWLVDRRYTTVTEG